MSKSLKKQIWNKVDDKVWDQVGNQVSDQVWNQVFDQVLLPTRVSMLKVRDHE